MSVGGRRVIGEEVRTVERQCMYLIIDTVNTMSDAIL